MAAAGGKNKKQTRAYVMSSRVFCTKTKHMNEGEIHTIYIIIYSVYNNNINYDMYRRNRKLLRRIRSVNIFSLNNKLAAGLG